MTILARSSKYYIEEARDDDFDAIVAVIVAAFMPNGSYHFLVPDSRKWSAVIHRTLKEIRQQKGGYIYKGVERATGRIIGTGLWTALEGDELRAQGAHALLPLELLGPGRVDPQQQAPPTSPAERFKSDLTKAVRAARARWIIGRPCHYLAGLAVHPDHQGHDVGESLVRLCMDQANKRQVPCWLEATPAGFPVYKSLGWGQVDNDADFDLSEYGGKGNGWGVYTLRFMLKLPEKVA